MGIQEPGNPNVVTEYPGDPFLDPQDPTPDSEHPLDGLLWPTQNHPQDDFVRRRRTRGKNPDKKN